MNKGFRIVGRVSTALGLVIYLCGVIYFSSVVAAMSGNPAMLPFSLFLAFVPIVVGVLVLRKNGGKMPAPVFIEKRQNKILLALLLVYASLGLIVGLTRGFK